MHRVQCNQSDGNESINIGLALQVIFYLHNLVHIVTITGERKKIYWFVCNFMPALFYSVDLYSCHGAVTEYEVHSVNSKVKQSKGKERKNLYRESST